MEPVRLTDRQTEREREGGGEKESERERERELRTENFILQVF